ncbi:hypothetical protein NDU88_003883 [Pleurodeles waltl]|uniref:Uncharacterized protein n=1 Tax=Pleurodeles waltl TaxID=8319 RepID=A0AAV7V2T3_PLEWA|nr:hypothetical protein NDU88_003883 [Pleurodeles waltl]
MQLVGESEVALPVGSPVRWDDVRFVRRSGASFWQQVAALGRGSLPVAAVRDDGQVGVFVSGARVLKSQCAPHAAVSVVGRAGASSVGVHAFKLRRTSKDGSKQAPPAIESDAERFERVLEEGPFGGASNMAAPSEASGFLTVERGRQQPSGGKDRATLSDMDIVVIDSDDEGEDGKAIDSEVGSRRLVRPSGLQVPVGARAPSGHRLEGRVKPGAVHLTSREAAVRESGSSDPNLVFVENIPASQSASSGLDNGEESLDYDEEDPVHGVQSVATVEKSKTSRRAVQGDRLSCRHWELAGNLLRGEVSGYEAGMVGVGYGDNAVVAQGKDNVDVAIQVSVGDVAEAGLDIGEESLDYNEEDPVHGVQSVATVEKSKTSRRAVQGDRLSYRHRELAGNLLRGEVSGCEAGMVGVGYGGNAVVAQGKGNVDVAVQVSVGERAEAGKLEASQGVADVVIGKLEVAQVVSGARIEHIHLLG